MMGNVLFRAARAGILAAVAVGGVTSGAAWAQDKFARAQQTVELIERLCLSNYRVGGEANLKLALSSLKNILAKGIDGSLSADASRAEVRGAVDFVDEKLKQGENDAIRGCAKPYLDRIVEFLLAPDKPAQIELRFRYALGKMNFDPYTWSDRVVLAMKTQSFAGRRRLVLEPEGFYARPIELPSSAARFEAWIVRDLKEAVGGSLDLPRTEVCLVERTPAPKTTAYFTQLECREGQACGFDIVDPGWVQHCTRTGWLPSFRLVAPARAQDGRWVWQVPSIESLDERWNTDDLMGSGFTVFSIASDDVADLAADSFTYDVVVNGIPVRVDGLPPDLVAERVDSGRALAGRLHSLRRIVPFEAGPAQTAAGGSASCSRSRTSTLPAPWPAATAST